jgi:hypothetical protein
LQFVSQWETFDQQKPNQLRNWSRMFDNSRKLWDLVKEKKSEKKTEKLSIELGVQDQINRQFASQVHKLKKHKKKLKKKKQAIPEEMKSDIPQNIRDLERNNSKALFNLFLELEGPKKSFSLKINLTNGKLK